MLSHSETRAKTQTICMVLVALVTVVTAMKLAMGLLAPVTLGLIIAIVAAPGMRLLARLGVPRAVSASISLLIVAIITVVLIAGLGPIVMDLIGQLPRIEDEIRWWVIEASRAIRGLESVQFELEQSLAEDGEAMEEAMPGILDALWVAPNFAAQLLTFAGTFFFFTLTQNEIYAYFPGRASSMRQADRAVSHYFVTVTAINAGLGTAVFAAMTIIGLPNPLLWGAAAFILNFVLYLGPVMLLVAFGVAGFTEFNGAYALLPALAYFTLNMTEAQFVTPTLVGQRLQLNPLVVFLAILFGLWIWGPIGGIVSLPVLVWTTAYLAHAPESQPEISKDIAPTQA
ncbi:AI-2E family transporter [uncultured Marivita sp.]|uniref:AI-2E family transporter n=1 Tax=uncultured Marivita sp. TaxID=888080 RepID=UPI00261507B6|nr:AI-2E family transporter [uncultured Marivita sp.]